MYFFNRNFKTKTYLCFFPFTDRKNTWMIPVFQNCSNCATFNSIYWRIIFTVFGKIRFFITFPKKLFRVSAVSSLVLTTSPFSVKCVLSLVTILSESEGPWNFRLSFHNTSFWIFVAEIHNNFFTYYNF